MMKRKGAALGLSVLLVVSLIVTMWVPVFAEGDKADGSSLVATSDEMAKPQEVGDEDLVPVYGDQVADGQYEIEVESSSSMFRITKAVLTVKDGQMSAVLTLGGKGYGKLFMGTGEEAVAASESQYIPYVEDAQGAYTYEVPVSVLDDVVKCAAWSKKKEKWYDRDLVFLSANIPEDKIQKAEVADFDIEDGTYQIDVTLTGGTGKASIESPAEVTVKNGILKAKIVWSSPNYDYMIVGGKQYDPVNTEGNSVFEIPVPVLDEEFQVIADTTAMSTPHEIEYMLRFDSETMKDAGDAQDQNGADVQEKAAEKSGGMSVPMMAVIAVLILIIVIAGIVIVRKNGKKKQ